MPPPPVRSGWASPPQIGGNTPPTTGDDIIRVKPGAFVTLPLLVNDLDMDGDNIGFVEEDAIDLPFDTEIVNGNSIRFTAPTEPGTYSGKYYVRDSANTLGNGNISVIVDENAPPLAPVAVDDMVAPETVVDKEYVDIEVLKNDYDLDADISAVTVTLPISVDGVSVVETTGAVRIPVKDSTQQVQYTITDADGGSATAVITLPGRNDLRPTLKDDSPLTVTAGERVVLELNQLVAGTNGRPVKLVSADRVYYTTGTMIPSPQKLEWTPALEYSGPAAVVFEVSDVVPDGDKTARSAHISIPVEVKPAPNLTDNPDEEKKLVQMPPELIGAEPVLEVGAGEGETRIDLRSFFRDPNGDEFRFERWNKTSGEANLTWRAMTDQQSLIYAQADVTAQPGSTAVLSGRVLDIHGNDRPVTVTLRVVPSTRPLPTAVTDLVPDANAGSPRSVNVLANDKSNLLTDTKLTLISARPLGAGSAKVEGDSVVVTPPEGYVGDMTVEYTIGDATNDPNRRSTGRIVLTVRSKPGVPGVPREVAVGDGYVTLQWTDGAANGLPILSRTLRVTRAESGGTSKSVECSSNTCTIDGLANGKQYWFQVTQTNELGSAESAESAPSKPDVVPEIMGQPTVKFGNGQLTISWPTGVSRGSPITEYRLTMQSGGSAAPVVVTAPSTSYTWTGLTNETDYTFTVAAKNEVGWSKAESTASVPEHPTGPPQAATNVVGIDAGYGIGRHLKVEWDRAPAGKDPILRYDVYATRVSNGQRVQVATVDADNPLSIIWNGAENDVEYQFSVVAWNRGPDAGAESAKSAPVAAFGAPNTPSGVNISAGDGSLFLTRGDPSQPQVTHYDVEVYETYSGRKVGDYKDVKVGEQIPGTYTNGTRYYARVKAWNKTKSSDWGGTNSATPIGAPTSPYWENQGDARPGDGAKRRVSWKMPDANLQGNSRDQVTIQYRVNGGGWNTVPEVQNYGSAGGGQMGNIDISTDGANATVEVRAVSADHGASPAASITVTPPLSMSLSGTTLTVRTNDTGGQLRCSVGDPFPINNEQLGSTDSFTVEHKDAGATPAPGGPYTVNLSCSRLGSTYTLTKSLGS
ncbi:Ig-like domain-containing protein [Propionibacteriaceae bacterium Y1923]